MSAIFDVIAAFAIGSMFLLTMMNTMFNIQTYGFNIEALMVLTETSKQAVDVLDNVVLSNVGSNEIRRTNGTVFFEALTDTTCSFWGQIDFNNNGVFTDAQIRIFIANDQLFVTANGNNFYGPIQLRERDNPGDQPGLRFSYLDADDNAIATPITAAAANLNPPFGVEVRIDFEEEGRGSTDFGTFRAENDGEINRLSNQIIFWRYFKSLHM